jgi:hypothetical protein
MGGMMPESLGRPLRVGWLLLVACCLTLAACSTTDTTTREYTSELRKLDYELRHHLISLQAFMYQDTTLSKKIASEGLTCTEHRCFKTPKGATLMLPTKG